jgi:hypothetical protein
VTTNSEKHLLFTCQINDCSFEFLTVVDDTKILFLEGSGVLWWVYEKLLVPVS